MPTPRPGVSRYDAGMVLVALIWGANFSAIKYALRSIPPLVFSASRFVLASLIFLIVVRWMEGPARIPKRTLWPLILLGLIGNTAYQIGFMIGLDQTTATDSALIMGALPVMVAVLATGFGVERLSRRLWAGLTLAVIGVAIVIMSRGGNLTGGTLRGDLLILGACFCWAVYTVGLRRIGQGVSALRVTAITTLAGTPGLVLVAWPSIDSVAWGSLDGLTWFGVLYSGVFAIVVAYTLWNVAVRGIGSSRTAVYNSLIPVVAALVAWLTLGERPAGGQIGGAGLVIAGVLVSQTGASRASDANAPAVPAD